MLLLTEAAYRLLSMEPDAAAEGKDCVVLVLGWPTEADGSLHPMQRFRVEAGLAVYQQQHCRQIIFSGGAARNSYGEGQTMAAYARSLGAPESSIAVEPDSRTTWENLGCSTASLERAERVFLVSDSLHARRAKRYACRQSPRLCAKSRAAGANPPAALFGWKVLNTAHELMDWLRDTLFYRQVEDNAPLCRARQHLLLRSHRVDKRADKHVQKSGGSTVGWASVFLLAQQSVPPPPPIELPGPFA